MENQKESFNNGTGILYNCNLEWKAIKNKTSDPDGIWQCTVCNNKVLTHPHYIKAGIKTCCKTKNCCELDVSIKQMCDLKGWQHIDTIKDKSRIEVKFKCNKGHENSVLYNNLRKGSNCKLCNNDNKSLSISRKIERQVCLCQGKKPNVKPRVCPHHNFLICRPLQSKEWDYVKNFPTRPENVAPNANKKFHWICGNEKCKMEYVKSPSDIVRIGTQCTYCTGNILSPLKNLLVDHPELCEELDPENLITPDRLLSNSNMKLNWICKKCKHKWVTSPNYRITKKSGCPR